jgi:uncharacterized protein (DUF433 family)
VDRFRGVKDDEGPEPAIAITPARYDGVPCVAGTSRAVAVVADRARRAGVDEVMRELDLSRPQVLVACWYDAREHADSSPWAVWADEWLFAMRSADWDLVPDPPGGDDVDDAGDRAEVSR